MWAYEELPDQHRNGLAQWAAGGSWKLTDRGLIPVRTYLMVSE